MSRERGLAEALASARLRAERSDDPAHGALSQIDTLTILRQAALLHGLNAEAVVTSYSQGGPLADLISKVIGAEVRSSPRRGRPPKLAETWVAFVSVVRHMRLGLSQEAAVARVALELDVLEPTVRSQYERTRDRDGVDPASVPSSSIVALYADPRPRR